jgi:hypothetical protein
MSSMRSRRHAASPPATSPTTSTSASAFRSPLYRVTATLTPVVLLVVIRRDPTRNPLRQEYVLPDFTSADRMKGFIKSGPNARKNVALDPAAAAIEAEREANEQLLVLNSERFAVPEILFNPSDIGAPLFAVGSHSSSTVGRLTRAALRDPQAFSRPVSGRRSLTRSRRSRAKFRASFGATSA